MPIIGSLLSSVGVNTFANNIHRLLTGKVTGLSLSIASMLAYHVTLLTEWLVLK